MTRLSDRAFRKFIPAPVGGANFRDPAWLIPNGDALRLSNVIPEVGYARTRGGTSLFCDLSGSANDSVDTLASLSLDGTEKFVAGAGNILFDITAGTPSNIKGAVTITRDSWATAVFRNRLFFANGADAELVWTGTGNVSAAGFTGGGPFHNLCAYGRRLFFITDSAILYYAALNALTGAVAQFDLGPVLVKGGYLIALAPISDYGPKANQEALAILTSTGEVVVYAGLSPEDSTWRIVARGFIGPPLGRRCTIYIGSELYFITRKGLIPISLVLNGSEIDSSYSLYSGKIEGAFTTFDSTPSNYTAVSMVDVPKKKYALLNLRPATGDITHYTMNLTTKAWGALEDWDARSIGVFGEEPYFGTSGGKIYKCDERFQLDPGDAAIAYSFMSGSQELDMPGQDKIVSGAKAIFLAQKYSGDPATISYDVNLDIDYEAQTGSTKTGNITSGSMKLNRQYENVNGQGQWVGVGLSGSLAVASELRFFGTNLYGGSAGV